MHQIKYTTTIDDLIEFSEYIHSTTPTAVRAKHMRLLMVPLVLVVASVICFLMFPFVFGVLMIVWAIITATINYAFYPRQLRRYFRKFYEDLNNQSTVGECVLEISADGITEESEGSSRRDAWSHIGSIEETPEAVYMMLGVTAAYIIPKARILEGDLDEFTNVAREFREAVQT